MDPKELEALLKKLESKNPNVNKYVNENLYKQNRDSSALSGVAAKKNREAIRLKELEKQEQEKAQKEFEEYFVKKHGRRPSAAENVWRVTAGLGTQGSAGVLELLGGISNVRPDRIHDHFVPDWALKDSYVPEWDAKHTTSGKVANAFFKTLTSPFRAAHWASKKIDESFLGEVFDWSDKKLEENLGWDDRAVGSFLSDKAQDLRNYSAENFTQDWGNDTANSIMNGLVGVGASIAGNVGGMGALTKLGKMANNLAKAKNWISPNSEAIANFAGNLGAIGMTAGVGNSIALDVYDTSLDYQLSKLPDYVEKKKQFEATFLQQYLKENPDAYPADVQIVLENRTKDFAIEYTKQNPEATKEAKEYAQKGAYAASQTNFIFGTVMNMGMGEMITSAIAAPFRKVATRRFSEVATKTGQKKIVENKALSEKLSFRGTMEGGLEALEEGVLEQYAEKKGELVGMGLSSSFTDVLKEIKVKDVIQNSAWGFVGGFGSTYAFHGLDFQGRRISQKRREEAEKQIAEFNKILEASNSMNLNEATYLNLSYKEQYDAVLRARALQQAGKEEEAEAILKKVIDNQALASFETGTTDALIKAYTAISANEELDIETRNNAKQAVEQIGKLEDLYNGIYNSSTDYLNKGAIYSNRASKISAQRKMEEIDKQIALKQTELLEEVATKAEAGKMTSLTRKRTVEEKGEKPGDVVVREVEETLDFDVNDLGKDTSKKYEDEESNKAYGEYKSQVEQFENAKQLQELKKQRRKAVEYIASLNDENSRYLSKEYQEQLKDQNELISTIRSKRDEISEKMQELSDEEFENYIDEFFKTDKRYDNKIEQERSLMKEQLLQQKEIVEAISEKQKQEKLDEKSKEFEKEKNPNKRQIQDDTDSKTDAEIRDENAIDLADEAASPKTESIKKLTEETEKEKNKNEVVIIPDLGEVSSDVEEDFKIINAVENEVKDEAANIEETQRKDDEQTKGELTRENTIVNNSSITDNELDSLDNALDKSDEKLAAETTQKEDFEAKDDDILLSVSKDNKDTNNKEKSIIDKLINNLNKIERRLGRKATFEDFLDSQIENIGLENSKKIFNAYVNIWKKAGLDFGNIDPYSLYNTKFESEKDSAVSFYNELANFTAENNEASAEDTREPFENVEDQTIDGIDESTEPTMLDVVNEETDAQLSFLNLNYTNTYSEDGAFVGRKYTNANDLNPNSDLDAPHSMLDPEKFLPGEELTVEIASDDQLNSIAVNEYDSNGDKIWSGSFNEWVEKYNVQPGSDRYINKIPMIVKDKDGKSVAFIRDTYWIAPFNIKDGTTKKEKINKARENNYNTRKAIWLNQKAHNKKTTLVIKKKTSGVYNGAKEKAKNFNEANGRYPTLKEAAGVEKVRNEDGEVIREDVQTHIAIYKDGKLFFLKRNEKGEKELVEILPENLNNNKPGSKKKIPLTAGNSPVQNYEIRVVGTKVNEDGSKEPIYHAFPTQMSANATKIGFKKSKAIFSLMYLNYLYRQSLAASTDKNASEQVRNEAKESLKKYKEKINEISEITGFDISKINNTNGIISLLKQYVPIKNIESFFKKGQDVTLTEISKLALNDNTIKEGEMFIYHANDSLYFGVKRKNSVENISFVNLSSGNKNVGNILANNIVPFIQQGHLGRMPHNISHNSILNKDLNNKKTILDISYTTDGKTADFTFEASEGSYEEELYDIVQSGFSAYNIGTSEEPKMVTQVQPVITYDIKEEGETKIKPSEKSNIEETAENNAKTDNNQAEISNLKQEAKETTDSNEKRDIENKIAEVEQEQKKLDQKKKGELTAEEKASNRKVAREIAELENYKNRVIEDLKVEQDPNKQAQLADIALALDNEINNKKEEFIVSKEHVEKDSYTELEIEVAKEKANQLTNFLEDISFDDGLAYPNVMSDEEVEIINQKAFGITDVSPLHINDLVEFINQKVSSTLLNNPNVSKEELLKDLEKELFNLLDKRFDQLNILRNVLLTDATEESKNTVEKLDRALEYLNNISNNYDVIVEEGFNKASIELNLNESREQQDADDNPEVNLDNTVEKNHSKTFLEEGGKSSLTYQLKRFFSEIFLTDINGNQIKGFLDTDRYYSFDEVYNTMQALLANSYPNFDYMIKRLENNVEAIPALQQVIDKLKSADAQIRNQFVSSMSMNNTGMQFISYSTGATTDLGGVSTSLSIYDTNSANVSRKISNTWFNNFFASDIIKNKDGKIYIDSTKAKEILDKYFNKQQIKYNNNAAVESLLSALIRSNKSKVPTSVVKAEVLNKLEEGDNLVSTVVNNKVESFIINKKRDTISVKKASENDRDFIQELKSGNVTKEGVDFFKDFLSEFGIYLSDKTINDLINNGLKVSKNKSIPFADLFLEQGGYDSQYIFGGLISYLKNSTKEDVEFDKEVNNPLQNSNFLKLAKLESRYNFRGIMPSSFRDGQKTIQQYTIPKFMTDRVLELKQPGSADFNSLLNCSFSENSYLLNLLANDPTIQENFNVNYVGINAIKKRNAKLFKATNITSISNVDNEIVRLAFFMNSRLSSVSTQNYNTSKGIRFSTRLGQVLSPTMSDKSVATVITMPLFDLDHLNLRLEDGEIGVSLLVRNLMYEQIILPEIKRMVTFFQNQDSNNIKDYDKGAPLFLMLPLLNNLKKDGISIVDLIKNKALKEHDFDVSQYVIKTFGDEINALLKDYVENEVSNVLDKWDNYGITSVDNNGNYIVKGIDSKLLNNKEKFGENTLLEDKVAMLAYDYVINSMISNANIFMTIAGDPATYYKSKSTDPVQQSKDTFNNMSKRLANQIAPRKKLADSEDNQYIQLFLEDIKAPANNLLYIAKALGVKEFGQKQIDSLTEAIKKGGDEGKQAIKKLENDFPLLAPYFQIEGTDAQEYTTWKEHLYVLEKLGKTNPELFHDKITSEDIENARKLFEDNVPFDEMTEQQKNLVKLVMQPMKPVYTGQMYDKTTKSMRTVYIKSSSIPLIPQLTKGFELDNLRQAMEAVEAKEGRTVRASYGSANKLGATSNSTKLFDNSNGNYLAEANENLPANEQLANRLLQNHLILPRKYFGIQQEVPFKSDKRKEDTVSQGTQVSKLLLGDGITDMSGFLFDGQEITGADLKQNFDNNFGKLAALTKVKLLKELNIDINTGLSTNPIKTAKALQKILKDEAQSRGYSKQVIDSLEYEIIYKNGVAVDYQFTIPLWMTAESNRFESLLNSIATNRVAKIKMPGNSYVASSAEGFKQVVTEQGGNASKIIFTSKFDGELKGAEFNKDGSLKKTQVFLPSKFRTNDGEMLNMFAKDGEGNYIYVTQEEEGGPFMLKEEMFDEELLSNISFRTPTSAHLSMADVEIVGFLPYECGDLIVVPRNLTTQVGLDFDIDKQTNYQYYHEIDENGKVVVLKDNIEELEKQLNEKRGELEEGNFEEFEAEYENILSEINEKQKLRKEQLTALKKDRKNSEEIIDKLWEQEIDIQNEIDFINEQIADLNKNTDVKSKAEVKAEVKNLSKKRKLLFRNKAKLSRERQELSAKKVRSKDEIQLQTQKNKEYRENTKVLNDARKEKWNKIRKYKNQLRFEISALESKLGKLYKNEIVKIHSSILSNPAVQEKIATPLSIQDEKDQAEKLNKIQSPKNISNYETFNPLTSSYQQEMLEAGAAGKVAIGGYSNDVVFHSLVRQNTTGESKIKFGEPIVFGDLVSDGTLGNDTVLVPEKSSAYISILSQVTGISGVDKAIKMLSSADEDTKSVGIAIVENTLFPQFSSNIQEKINTINNPRRISNVLTGRQNIATDNAKELVMQPLGLNNETLDVDKIMILLGFDKDASGNSIPFFFLNQPIIKEFIEEYKNLDSVIADYVGDKEQYVFDKLVEKYNFDTKNHKRILSQMAKKMNGSNLEAEIKYYSDNESFKNNNFQFAALMQFINLRKAGKQLRDIQQNFNIDSQGIGKSIFDIDTRIDRLKNLFQNNPEIGKLIGEYSTSPKEGFIPIRNFYVKPTTAIGHTTVNTLVTAIAISEKHMPYNNLIMEQLFNEIVKIKGGNLSPYALTELKQNIVKGLKKYLNSMDFGFYTFNPKQEREYLFIDGTGENEQSLASYLQGALLDPDGINFSFLNSIPLFKQIDFAINKDGNPSLIKINNTVDNIDENSLYSSIPKLLEKDIRLPNFNGRHYTSRMLAQDLINYALLEGGVQEAIQIAKYIPAAYLKNSNYKYRINSVSNNLKFGSSDLKSLFGLTMPVNLSGKSTNYNISKFAIQFMQHNPTIAQTIKLDNTGVSNIAKDQETGEVLSFSFSSKTEMPAFLRVYNGSANKNSDLYITKDGINYYKIDTKGAVGMDEYNAQAENFHEDSMLPKKSKISNSDRFEVEATKNENKNEKSDLENKPIPFQLEKESIDVTLQSISKSDSVDPELKYLANLLLEISGRDNNKVNIVIGRLKKGADGVYSKSKNTIAFDKSKLETNSHNETARIILHEYIHKLTVSEIDKYYDITGKQPDIKINAKPGVKIPTHISGLVRLYNKFVKEAEEGITFKDKAGNEKVVTLESIKSKLKKGESLDPNDEFSLYGGIDIYEFIVACMTDPGFQNVLENIDYTPQMSMREKFKDLIKNLLKSMRLSLGLSDVKDSALTEALDYVFEILDIPSAKGNTELVAEIIEANNNLKQIDNAIDEATKPLPATDKDKANWVKENATIKPSKTNNKVQVIFKAAEEFAQAYPEIDWLLTGFDFGYVSTQNNLSDTETFKKFLANFKSQLESRYQSGPLERYKSLGPLNYVGELYAKTQDQKYLNDFEKYIESDYNKFYKEVDKLINKIDELIIAADNIVPPSNSYKGVPVEDTTDITNYEGGKGAAQYDRANNIIKVNRELLRKKYNEKAWTNMRNLVEEIDGVKVESKAENLPSDQFNSYQEFENFVIEHEYQHSIYSRQDFDKEFPGKTKGDYETEINRRALKNINSPTSSLDSSVPVKPKVTVKGLGTITSTEEDISGLLSPDTKETFFPNYGFTNIEEGFDKVYGKQSGQVKQSEVLLNILKLNNQPSINELAKFLLSITKDSDEITISGSTKTKARGTYYPRSGKISIFKNKYDEGFSNRIVPDILHELLHKYTADPFVKKEKNKKLTKNEEVFVNNISKIWKEVRKERGSLNFPGNANEIELIAEVFTNKEFQEELSYVKYKDTNQSIWNKFLEILSDFFNVLAEENYNDLKQEFPGIEKKPNFKDTALNALIKETISFIETEIKSDTDVVLASPSLKDVFNFVESKFDLRNEDGSRKRFPKKDYKTVLKKTQNLNKGNKHTSFQFKITEVMGEKGDKRTYYAIEVIKRNNINFSNATELDNLINKFEQTCK